MKRKLKKIPKYPDGGSVRDNTTTNYSQLSPIAPWEKKTPKEVGNQAGRELLHDFLQFGFDSAMPGKTTLSGQRALEYMRDQNQSHIGNPIGASKEATFPKYHIKIPPFDNQWKVVEDTKRGQKIINDNSRIWNPNNFEQGVTDVPSFNQQMNYIKDRAVYGKTYKEGNLPKGYRDGLHKRNLAYRANSYVDNTDIPYDNRFNTLRDEFPDKYTAKEAYKDISPFQRGGIIKDNQGQWKYPYPMLQAGGPIITNDPNDPRLKAQSDTIRDPNVLNRYKLSNGLVPDYLLHNQYNQYSQKPEEKGWLDKVDDVLSAPQRAVTWALTGKYQNPSDALGIKNKWGKMAADLVLDPMNLLGVGIMEKIGKAGKIAEEVDKTVETANTIGKTKSVYQPEVAEHLKDMLKDAKQYYGKEYDWIKPGRTKYPPEFWNKYDTVLSQVYKDVPITEARRRFVELNKTGAGVALINDLIQQNGNTQVTKKDEYIPHYNFPKKSVPPKQNNNLDTELQNTSKMYSKDHTGRSMSSDDGGRTWGYDKPVKKSVPVSKPKPIPQPITKEAKPIFGQDQRPYDSIMMPSGQSITKEQFIKQYGEKVWNDKYGKQEFNYGGQVMKKRLKQVPVMGLGGILGDVLKLAAPFSMAIPGVGPAAAMDISAAGNLIGDKLKQGDIQTPQSYQPSFINPNGQQSTISPPTFETGGKVYGDQLAELENGETFRTPQGQITNVEGDNHSSGGETFGLPEGTQVMSKILNSPSFRKATRGLSTKKYEKILEDKNSDDLQKQAAQNNIKVNNDKFTELYKIQEMKKRGIKPTGSYSKGGQVPKYWTGGTNNPEDEFNFFTTATPYWANNRNENSVPPQYKDMSNIDPPMNGPFLGNTSQVKILSPDGTGNGSTYKPSSYNGGMPLGKFSPMGPQYDRGESMNPINSINPSQISTNTSTPSSLSNTRSTFSPSPTPPPNSSTPWWQTGAEFVINSLGDVKNLFAKSDRVNYKRADASYLDPSADLTDADIQNRMLNKDIASASGGNSGNYLSNRVASGTANTINKSRIRSQYSNTNAGIRNQFSQYNNQIANKEIEDQAMNDQMAQDRRTQALSQIGFNAADALYSRSGEGYNRMIQNEYNYTYPNRRRFNRNK